MTEGGLYPGTYLPLFSCYVMLLLRRQITVHVWIIGAAIGGRYRYFGVVHPIICGTVRYERREVRTKGAPSINHGNLGMCNDAPDGRRAFIHLYSLLESQ